MGYAAVKVLEIKFDFRNDEVTEVEVICEGIGDVPHTVQGSHHKTFPASRSALDILQNEIAKSDFLLW